MSAVRLLFPFFRPSVCSLVRVSACPLVRFRRPSVRPPVRLSARPPVRTVRSSARPSVRFSAHRPLFRLSRRQEKDEHVGPFDFFE